MAPSSRPVVVLPGDGIGPEVVAAALAVVDATGVGLSFEHHEVGQRAYDTGGDALPASVVAAVRRCGVALKGPLATPVGAPFRSVNVALRRELDLYAQVRPVRTFAGAPSRYSGVDVLVIRETTEDLYRGVEFAADTPQSVELAGWLGQQGHELPDSCGISLKPVSGAATRRAVRRALDHARAAGRRRVTVAHKASVMRATDGLFLREALVTAEEYPELVVDAMAVDAAAAELVRRPEQLDVLLTLNLYGDVLSDVAAALVGGLGLAPGVNLGDEMAVFEAAHGTAPRHAGADTANPFAMILSAAMMLDHLGHPEQGERVRAAVGQVIRDGVDVPADLRAPDDPRQPVGTRRAGQAVVELLR